MKSTKIPLWKKAAILALCAIVLAGLTALYHKMNHAVVLEYHCVEETPFSSAEELFVRPSELEDQIRALQEAGYRFAFAGEVNPVCLRKTVCLTFDDGYRDNLTELVPILERTGAKATVFVVTDLIGFNEYFLTAEDLKTLAVCPYIEIASHGITHRDFLELTEEELEEELVTSKAQLEEITGREILSFSYPSGHYTWAQAKRAGEVYRNCFTAAGRSVYLGLLNHRNVLPRVPVRRGEDGKALLQKLRGALPGWDIYSGY